jgi:hypothetical protein
MTNADVAAGGLVLPLDERELNLERARVGVAGVGRLEHGPVVATAGREQLGGVVDLGELEGCQ